MSQNPHRPSQSAAPAWLTRDVGLWRDRVLPGLRRLIDSGYYSLTVEGAEHLPRSGPVVYAANHAGWFALDSMLFVLALTDAVGIERLPWGVGADVLHRVPGLAALFRRLGTIPASALRSPESLPPEIDSIGVFPEGVSGNCKPFWHAYHMREWRRGFVRLAIARRAPIVPVAILGGEESLPLLGTLTATRRLLGTEVPVPLLPLPLPASWRVIFHPPVSVERLASDDQQDSRECRELARHVQEQVQRTLHRQARGRLLWRIASQVAGAAGERVSDRERA